MRAYEASLCLASAALHCSESSEQSVRFAERVLKANGALGVNARIRGVPLFSIRGFALQRVVEKDAGAG
jgi:hypothetical protein